MIENVWWLPTVPTSQHDSPSQGPYKKWTEHFTQSHFLKLQLLFGWILWTMKLLVLIIKSPHQDLLMSPVELGHLVAQTWQFFEKLRTLASYNNLRIIHDSEFAKFCIGALIVNSLFTMSAPQMPCIYLCHAKNSLNWCKIIKIIRSSLCCNISTGFFCEFLLVVMVSVSSISKDVLASVDQSNLIGSFFGPYAIYRLVIYVPSLNVFRSNLRYWKWHYGKQIYPHMRSQFL